MTRIESAHPEEAVFFCLLAIKAGLDTESGLFESGCLFGEELGLLLLALWIGSEHMLEI
jgi:hypothetical protein